VVLSSFVPIAIFGITPRAAAALLIVFAATAALGNLLRSAPAATWFNLSWPKLAILVFAGWALASTAWSLDPMESATKAFLLALMSAAAALTTHSLYRLNPSTANKLVALGVTSGTTVLALFLLIELLNDQVVARYVLHLFPSIMEQDSYHIIRKGDQIIALSDTTINRRIAVFTLLICPVLLSIHLLVSQIVKLPTMIAAAVVAFLIIAISSHQSSLVGAIVGILTFTLALYSPSIAFKALAGVWCIAVLVAVPLAKLPHTAGLHNAPWLFESARQRSIIWNYIADRTMEQPIFGIGAGASAEVSRNSSRQNMEKTPAAVVDPEAARHPHNGFLQVWYELGAIGAMLFCIVGLSAIRATKLKAASLSRLQQACIAAQIAVIMPMIAFSYSIWQTWFQAILLFSVTFTVNAIAGGRISQPRGH
jgi:hypothetical protein